LKERRVRFTATASQLVNRERTWWLENRDRQELFAIELENAIRILALLPGAGTPYVGTDIAELRRLYVRKLACHVYYTFDDDEVIVRALWGARRDRGPTIG
jgi:plasmid stabilization system protein ParE